MRHCGTTEFQQMVADVRGITLPFLAQKSRPEKGSPGSNNGQIDTNVSAPAGRGPRIQLVIGRREIAAYFSQLTNFRGREIHCLQIRQ